MQYFQRENTIPWHPQAGGSDGLSSIRLCEYECYLQARDAGVVSKQSEFSLSALIANTLGEAKTHPRDKALKIIEAVRSIAELSLENDSQSYLRQIDETRAWVLFGSHKPSLTVPPLASLIDLSVNTINASALGAQDVLSASSILCLFEHYYHSFAMAKDLEAGLDTIKKTNT